MKKITKIIASASLLIASGIVAQNATLLKDINSLQNIGSNPSANDGAAIGSTFYFSATNDLGTELYKTDGTTAGTVLVKDIYVGKKSSYPNTFKIVGTTVFFIANDGINGNELWMIDGTSAGPKIVIDTYTGTNNSSNPSYLTVVGSYLYWKTYDNNIGEVIYKVDASGNASLVVDPNNNPNAAGPYGISYLTAVGSTVFFQAYGYSSNYSTAYGYELWKTDGTSLGTVLVKDINTGYWNSSSPSNFIAVGSTLFFRAYTPANGNELWKSDGTSAGTVLVNDINSGSGSSNISNLVATNTNLFFTYDDGTHGNELWTSDGTLAGTQIVNDLYNGSNGSTPFALATIGSSVYFSIYNHPSNSYKLFKSDGTSAGTVLVSGAANLNNGGPIVAVGSNLFFNGYEGAHGYELWKSDGTSVGTVLVKDINSIGSSYPQNIGGTASSVYFSSDNGISGYELWKTDGTSAGTLLLQIGKGLTGGSGVSNLAKFGNTLFFIANDAVNGTELWKSDGTEVGSVLVKNIAPGAASFNFLGIKTFSNSVYFAGNDGVSGQELWKTDGTSAGTVVIDLNSGAGGTSFTGGIGNLGNTLFFTGDITGGGNSRLYKTMGTTASTQLVYAGFTSVNDGFIEVNGMLYFAANDGVNGTELWATDGTSANTKMVKNINVSGASYPSNIVAIGSTIYFFADNGVRGKELWKSDGTDAGTEIVADINNTGGIDPNGWNTNLVVLGNSVYFSAYEPAHGYELWTSDGTQSGTKMVKDIYPGSNSSRPNFITVAGSYIYFHPDYYNNYLWRSDGTSAGTVLVDTYNQAYNPQNIVAVGSLVAFTANDNINNMGNELFISDGTASGTYLTADINVNGSSNISSIINMNEQYLTFSANDGFSGDELWRVDAPSVISASSLGEALCSGTSYNLTYTVTQGLLNSGNQFKVDLSDGLGDFTNSINVGSITGTSTTGSIPVTIPSNMSGLGYKLRVAATNQASIPNASTAYIVADAPIVITGSTTFCSGLSTTLTVKEGLNYIWSTQETAASITLSAAGSVSITATDNYGCVKTKGIQITEGAAPVVVITGNTSYCIGESTMITASGATSYSWNPASGISDPFGSNVTFVGSITTAYTLTAANAACSSTAIVIIEVSNCGKGVGIEELSNNALKVYPNPASEAINIQMDLTGNTFATLKITNIQGKVIFQENNIQPQSNYSKSIDMSKEAKGVYWLQVITDKGINTNKIVIQ